MGFHREEEFSFATGMAKKDIEPWKSAYRDMLTQANLSLKEKPEAPFIWTIPGYYDDSEGHKEAKALMASKAKAAYATAMAYKFTGNQMYAQHAADLIQAWCTNNRAISGADGPLVSAYAGVGLIHAAGLIKSYDRWDSKERYKFNVWLKDLCIPEWEGIVYRNNWWDWSLFAQIAAFDYMEDIDMVMQRSVLLKAHMDASISNEPDANGRSGCLPKETVRGAGSLWYHYFALSPMTAAARIVRHSTGEDLFRYESPSGGSIRLAVDYLFYYIRHPQEWPWHDSPNLPDASNSMIWPINLLEAMGEEYGSSELSEFAASHRPIYGGAMTHFSWVYPTLMRACP